MTVRVSRLYLRPDRRHPRHGPPAERRARRLGRRRLALGARGGARPLAPPRAHGLQGHRDAIGGRDRRGDRGGRRRGQCRDQRRDDLLLRPRPQGRRAARRSTSSATSCAIRSSIRTSWSASSTSSSRRSARRSMRRRTASTTSSPQTAYPDQPIGRTILGTPETVKAAASPMLDAYLDRHYRGPAMVIAAAGAVDHDRLVAMAARALRRRSAPTPARRRRRPTYRGGDAREERDLMETQIMLGFEGVPYASKDFYTAQILASIIGGGMSSRLFQEVREKRGLCYSIYAFHWSFADTGIFGVHAATGPERRRRADAGASSTSSSAPPTTSDEDESKRARAQLRAGLLMTLESPAARAGQIARQLLLFGRLIPIEELVAKIDGDQRRDVRDLAARFSPAARRRSPPSARSMACIGPRPHRRAVRRAHRAPELDGPDDGVPPLDLDDQRQPDDPRRAGDAARAGARRLSRNGRSCARRAARSWRRGSRSGRPTT